MIQKFVDQDSHTSFRIRSKLFDTRGPPESVSTQTSTQCIFQVRVTCRFWRWAWQGKECDDKQAGMTVVIPVRPLVTYHTSDVRHLGGIPPYLW